MNKFPSYILTDTVLTYSYGGKTLSLPRDHECGLAALDAIRNNDFEALLLAGDRYRLITAMGVKDFYVQDNDVFLKNGYKIGEHLADRIITFLRQGLPVEPLVKFAEKIQKNPSPQSVSELYKFLEANHHPITSDGNFIAYKKVRNDYMDCHSNTMYNGIGEVLSMPRELVDARREVTCSTGLHVASYKYADEFRNGIMLEVEVDPQHVVSVPSDYRNSKMRTCQYKVVGHAENELKDQLIVREEVKVEQPAESGSVCKEHSDDCPYLDELDEDEEECACYCECGGDDDIDDDEEEDEDEDCDCGECVDDEETEDEEVEDEIVHVTSQKKLLKFVAIHGETPTSILRLTSDDLDAVSPQKLTAMLRNSGYVLPVGKVKVLRTNDIVLVVNKDNNNKIYYKTTQDV